MTVIFEYPNKYTFSKIKTKTLSHTPKVTGLKNYLFRIKNPFEGININPSNGVIIIGKKATPGNYILEIDCVDSVNNKIFPTKHVVFIRDPNKVFPGDDELSDSEEDNDNKDNKDNNDNKDNKDNKNNKDNKDKKLNNKKQHKDKDNDNDNDKDMNRIFLKFIS